MRGDDGGEDSGQVATVEWHPIGEAAVDAAGDAASLKPTRVARLGRRKVGALAAAHRGVAASTRSRAATDGREVDGADAAVVAIRTDDAVAVRVPLAAVVAVPVAGVGTGVGAHDWRRGRGRRRRWRVVDTRAKAEGRSGFLARARLNLPLIGLDDGLKVDDASSHGGRSRELLPARKAVAVDGADGWWGRWRWRRRRRRRRRG